MVLIVAQFLTVLTVQRFYQSWAVLTDEQLGRFDIFVSITVSIDGLYCEFDKFRIFDSCDSMYLCMYSGIRWTFSPLCPLKSRKKEKQTDTYSPGRNYVYKCLQF